MHYRPIVRSHARNSILAVLFTCLLCLLTTLPALAATVRIEDQANVLDDSRIQQAANDLRFPLRIITTKTFNGTVKDLQNTANRQITSKNLVVIALDTRNKNIAIASGKDTKLSTSQLRTIANTLEDTYESNGNYTQAVLAALDKLPKNAGFNVVGILIIIGIIIAIVLLFFVFFKRRRRSHPVHHASAPYESAPEYTPPGYSPYPQHHQSHQEGISPLAAGAAGLAAGGLVGYALGQAGSEPESMLGASVSEDIDEEDETFHSESDEFGGSSVGDFGGESAFGSGGDFGDSGDSGDGEF